MGLIPCSSPKNKKSQSNSNSNHLYSESSNSSISSQLSLPSVPSLNPHEQETKKTHYICISTLKGHTSYISSLALAGKLLYSASSNGEIRSWTRDFSNSLNQHVASTSTAIKSLVVSKDNLFSAHQDNKIRVWNIKNAQLKRVATLPTLEDRVLRCFLPGNYVRIRRHRRKTWVHHVDAVSALGLSRDGFFLYSGSWDRTFKIWRTSDFKCMESVQNAHDDAISAIALSQDGYVYTGSADTKIKVWKMFAEKKNTQFRRTKHTEVAVLEKHKSAVNALALSDDGKILYSGASDRSILVWEREDGGMVLVGALRGHSKAVLCLSVVNDLVCSGSADKTVRVWRRGIERSFVCLAVLEGHQRPVKCLAAVADDGGGGGGGGGDDDDDDDDDGGCGSSFVVYSGSLDCDIKVWQLSVPLL